MNNFYVLICLIVIGIPCITIIIVTRQLRHQNSSEFKVFKQYVCGKLTKIVSKANDNKYKDIESMKIDLVDIISNLEVYGVC